jgi:hypothetical protein
LACLKHRLGISLAAAPHEAKDTQGIDVVAQRQAVGLDQSARGLDVSPGGLVREKVGEQ